MQWDKSFFLNLYEAKKCNGYKIIAKGKKNIYGWQDFSLTMLW